MKQIKKAGKYTVILNAGLLRKNLTVFINISLKEHQFSTRNKFVEDISKLKYVMEFYNTSGRYDFLLKVKVNSVIEYKDFLINKISHLDNIRDIESQIVLDEIKCTTALALDTI